MAVMPCIIWLLPTSPFWLPSFLLGYLALAIQSYKTLVLSGSPSAPHHQSKVQVFTCTSDWRGSNNPLLRVSLYARVVHRTKRNTLVTRSPVHYKRVYLSGIARWKRFIGQNTGKVSKLPCRLQAAHHSSSTSNCSPTPKLSEPNPLVSYEGFIT